MHADRDNNHISAEEMCIFLVLEINPTDSNRIYKQ